MVTDPDADRIGIAVPDEKGKYVLLNGNETGSILLYYILLKKSEMGIPCTGSDDFSQGLFGLPKSDVLRLRTRTTVLLSVQAVRSQR